jgi:hypothetical protein
LGAEFPIELAVFEILGVAEVSFVIGFNAMADQDLASEHSVAFFVQTSNAWGNIIDAEAIYGLLNSENEFAIENIGVEVARVVEEVFPGAGVVTVDNVFEIVVD